MMSGFREEEDDQEGSLRPKPLRAYVGQQAVKDSLNIYNQPHGKERARPYLAVWPAWWGLRLPSRTRRREMGAEYPRDQRARD